MTLELGGNGAVIVEPDANLDYVAERCAFGGFLRAGQACISVQRLYAHSSIIDQLQEKLLERIAELQTGDPLDDSTVVGYSGRRSTRASSPTIPRRNVSTHATKIAPCTTVTQAPSCAR